MRAASFLGRSVFLRELLPQDLKLEIDQLTRKEWRATLARNRSKKLDAPSWLWSSVVALMVSHEAGYLEHCRQYARATKAN